MACGKPVVSSSISASSEDLDHEKGGYLCEPGSVHQLVNAIRKLAHSDAATPDGPIQPPGCGGKVRARPDGSFLSRALPERSELCLGKPCSCAPAGKTKTKAQELAGRVTAANPLIESCATSAKKINTTNHNYGDLFRSGFRTWGAHSARRHAEKGCRLRRPEAEGSSVQPTFAWRPPVPSWRHMASSVFAFSRNLP